MPWAAIGGAVASSVVGNILAPDAPSSGAGSAAAAADPFASQRAQYMPALQSLMGQSQSFGQSQAQQRLDEMLYGSSRTMTQAATAGTRGAMLTPGSAAVAGTAGYWYKDPNQHDSVGESYIQGTAGTAAVAPTYAPDTPGTAAVYETTTSNGFAADDPSYAWRFDQGMEAVNRSAGAAGMLNSGNRLTALSNYGQGSASQEYQAQFARLSSEAGRQYSQDSADYSNQFSRLSQLSGANSGQPGAAGQIMANQNAQQNQAAGAVASTVGNAVNSWMTPSSNGGSSWNTGGGTANNASAYSSDNSSIPYQYDNNSYSPTW